MKKILYKCEKCSHVSIQEGWKLLFVESMKLVAIIATISFAVLGVLSVYNFLAVQVYESPGKMITLNWVFEMKGRYLYIQPEDRIELKTISEEITIGCETDLCKMKRVFNNLTEFPYETGTNIDPIKTWVQHSGDCDEMSTLAIQLLKTQGIKGNLVTSLEADHAYAVFYLGDEKYKMDVVNNFLGMM